MPKENKNPLSTSYPHLDKIGEIPLAYGFQPRQSPAITKADLDHAKTLLDGDSVEGEVDGARLPLHVEEKTALLRMYEEEHLYNMPQPVMLYFKEPFKGSVRKGSSYPRYADLEVIGGSGSIAEAAVIQAARLMLAEEGYTNVMVEINSIGDKDSIARWSRELVAYYRKHINDMHPECRELMKRDPFELLSSRSDACRALNDGAPRAMDFLSEESRQHFQEVLEYLEALNVPYEINSQLLGNRKYCTETVFTIVNADRAGAKHKGKGKKEHKILAIGVRYDGLSKKIGMRREIQGIGLSLLVPGTRADLRKEVKRSKRPFASFVQLGFESKLLSLSVIETLRGAKIPLFLSLAKDRLGAQVSVVERHHVPYSLIIGKKEAVEKTAIVRDNTTHAQETVPLEELPAYMKRLEKKLGK